MLIHIIKCDDNTYHKNEVLFYFMHEMFQQLRFKI